jgi:hypothetical protein
MMKGLAFFDTNIFVYSDDAPPSSCTGGLDYLFWDAMIVHAGTLGGSGSSLQRRSSARGHDGRAAHQ